MSSADRSPPESLPPSSAGLGTVLVVDDEVMVRDVICKVLEFSGFRVLSAGDGREAIELFRRHREEIDAVVLDLRMPKLSGGEALVELCRIEPDVRVVLMSGYPEESVRKLTTSDNVIGFFQKPFQPFELLDLLQESLL